MTCKADGTAIVPTRVPTETELTAAQMVLMSNGQCECEYADHFSPPDELGDAHAYAHVCEGVRPVETIYGTYMICTQCTKDHPIPANMLEADIPKGSPPHSESTTITQNAGIQS